jgi:p-cumate 2,3-dioxygenase beta subunit
MSLPTDEMVLPRNQISNQATIEAFLYEEAAMLDEWRLDDWFALFAEGATYEVPQAGASDDTSSSANLFYISDSYFRLRHRVERLKKPGNHSEWPRSVCSRLIGNVRILENEGGVYRVTSKFITHRSKNDITDMFCGHHLYKLKPVDGDLRILEKRTQIDMNTLRPQGRISIIV